MCCQVSVLTEEPFVFSGAFAVPLVRSLGDIHEYFRGPSIGTQSVDTHPRRERDLVMMLKGVRHLATLGAWFVTIAVCLSLLVPLPTSVPRVLVSLARVSLAVDAPSAVSVLQPVELLPESSRESTRRN